MSSRHLQPEETVNEAPEAYRETGYVRLTGFMPEEACIAFLSQLKADLAAGGVSLSSLATSSALLQRSAVELYAFHYAPMAAFLWGMTPAIAQVTGLDLLPTYAYLRIYRSGDLCRIHSDRHACEHSVSLTLANGEGHSWPLDIGTRPIPEPRPEVRDDFEGESHIEVPMAPGDAVLYQGVHRRHGRLTPNPNSWSAHLFLHWVDRNGPYRGAAFDGRPVPKAVRWP